LSFDLIFFVVLFEHSKDNPTNLPSHLEFVWVQQIFLWFCFIFNNFTLKRLRLIDFLIWVPKIMTQLFLLG